VLFALAPGAGADDVSAQEEAAPGRVVTIGASVTETAFALGAGEAVVGVDTSSTRPAGVRRLPRVGYARQLSAEGVLSLAPAMVLATDDAGPAGVLDQLRSAGVDLRIVEGPASVARAHAGLRMLGEALGRGREAAELQASMDARLADLAEATAGTDASDRPRVLFLINPPGAGGLMAAGRNTAAAEMLALAGATNVAADIDGYKPISAEFVVTVAPDVLAVLGGALERSGGVDGLLATAGLGTTPAGSARRVVEVAPELLAFGPNTGDDAWQVYRLLGQGR
jgi:iron complex transport system substrate-binding protein